MKIAFNFHGSGAGNNGGTQSVFLAAIALDALGHDVECWSNMPNRHNWIKLPPSIPFIRKKRIHDHDPVDVLVALGAKSVKSTVAFKKKEIGVYWIRGYETWQHPKGQLIKGYRSGLELCANSNWLCEHVSMLSERPCELIRPGIDTEFFTPTTFRNKKVLTVGMLWSTRPIKRAKFAAKVVRTAGGMMLWTLAAYKPPKNLGHKREFVRPTRAGKRTMLQSVDIWLAPSISEGLHLPPMEAGLCGCALVANSNPRGGMADYANENTAMLFERDNMDEAVAGLRQLAADPALRKTQAKLLRKQIVKKIGTPQQNMEKFVSWLASK